VARVTKDVKKYVNSCNIYQKMKNRTNILVEKLMVNEVPEKLWTYLIVDFITKLLLVARKDTILVVCNSLSKNNTFCSNNRRNIGRNIGKVV